MDLIITLSVLFLAFLALFLDLWSPDAVLLTALAVVTAAGVIELEQALQGFGNSTLLALGSLYVVAAALRESGALDRAGEMVLGSGDQRIRRILLRMCPGVTVYSAFLNNTPIVAMGIPAIRRWSRKNNIPASKLLIPLSYAAILGGTCTLIGTSTNLITHGLLQSHGMEGLSFFELAWLGVPCAIAGLLYIIFISPRITPVRKDIREEEEQSRQELVEMEITEDSDIPGKTVEEAGLAKLPGFFLSRVNREEREIAPVRKDFRLKEQDRLFFAPEDELTSELPDLSDYPGLRLAMKPPRVIERNGSRDRELHQVVVKEGSRLVGSTVEEAKLLQRFSAAVTGVRRGGERVRRPLGEFVLRPGDVLLLDTKRGFHGAHEDSAEFFLTSEAGGEEPGGRDEPEEKRSGGRDLVISSSVLAAIILSVTLGWLHIALAGVLGVAVLLAFGVLEPGEARRSVDWTVLIVIGSALGLGQAMEVSGAAEMVGDGLVSLTFSYGPRVILAGIIIASVLMTEVITNNGAVALMFPIALSVAQTQGLEPRAMLIVVTLASSLSFLTPIGYQTNLMIYGPGNYRFTDFTRVGFPLQLILWSIIVALAPVIWPF